MKQKTLLILMLIALTATFTACGCGSTSKSSGNKKSESSRESDDDGETKLKSWLNQFSESETAPETDNVPEENDAPEANVTPETDTVPETVISSESEPASVPEVEASSEDATAPESVTFPEDSTEQGPSPEELAAAAEAEKTANILSCMNATFSGALDHLVPEKKLDSASKVSNAILLNTTYSISSADEKFCTVTVRYPNAAAALTEALSTLSMEATEEQTNEMLENLAEKIENQEVEMIEKTYTAEVIQADDMYTIKWTTELFDAFTGGLYSIE